MENDSCPGCEHNPVLDAIQTRFREGVFELFSRSVAEAHKAFSPEELEQCERRDGFALAMADDLLYLAAKVYDYEGVPNSEAIYQLAQELERVENEDREEGPRMVIGLVAKPPPSSDAN
jgi:hypothetical protein